MPLIALDILEERIKELLIIIKHLKEENEMLKKEAAGKETLSPELKYEIETLKKTIEKYKNDRNFLYTKIAAIVKQIESMSGE
ncbi:MAG TPA: hypothetical protein ENN55_03560 [Firmicutes bacterium]|nr:hypothetical protein [Bacillota bacterium]